MVWLNNLFSGLVSYTLESVFLFGGYCCSKANAIICSNVIVNHDGLKGFGFGSDIYGERLFLMHDCESRQNIGINGTSQEFAQRLD